MVDKLLASDMHDVLLHNDQLINERRGGTVLNYFLEAPIKFKPTYKFDVKKNNNANATNEHMYDTSAKQRVPSWTDRILFRSNNNNNNIKKFEYIIDPSLAMHNDNPLTVIEKSLRNLVHYKKGAKQQSKCYGIWPIAYGSCPDIYTSDHKPVYGCYDVLINNKSLENNFNNDGDEPLGDIDSDQEEINKLLKKTEEINNIASRGIASHSTFSSNNVLNEAVRIRNEIKKENAIISNNYVGGDDGNTVDLTKPNGEYSRPIKAPISPPAVSQTCIVM